MSERHCIVGAGPGGLAAARAFLNLGLAIDVFERHSNVGGIWDRENTGTPMYESAHFISSRDLSAYHGYKMPNDYPDYPNQKQILAYVRNFADAYGITQHVRFDTSVESASFDGSHWQVRTSDGTTRAYKTLTCANGTQWFPVMPTYPGMDSFTGSIVHSQSYNEGNQLAGKRVLIVGAGNSGVDIACDAARFASRAVICVRRGYHLIPKHILGMPADEFGESGPHLPLKISQFIFPKLLKIVMGDPSKHGWPKPDHKLFETHPIVNDQILHYLRHGDLTVRREIASFDGCDVVFTDGKREPFDLVIMATGYETKVPYLDRSMFSWRGNRPSLYMRIFSPSQPGLSAIGFTEGDGGAYELFDDMADMIARTALAAERDPGAFAALRKRFAGPDIDMSGGVKYKESDRHAAYVNLHTWKKASKEFRKEFGWPAVEQETFEHLRTANSLANSSVHV
jgi:Flavin-binding monooxygenase-like